MSLFFNSNFPNLCAWKENAFSFIIFAIARILKFMEKNEKQMDGRDTKCDTSNVNTLWGALIFKGCIKTNPRVKKKITVTAIAVFVISVAALVMVLLEVLL